MMTICVYDGKKDRLALRNKRGTWFCREHTVAKVWLYVLSAFHLLQVCVVEVYSKSVKCTL